MELKHAVELTYTATDRCVHSTHSRVPLFCVWELAARAEEMCIASAKYQVEESAALDLPVVSLVIAR